MEREKQKQQENVKNKKKQTLEKSKPVQQESVVEVEPTLTETTTINQQGTELVTPTEVPPTQEVISEKVDIQQEASEQTMEIQVPSEKVVPTPSNVEEPEEKPTPTWESLHMLPCDILKTEVKVVREGSKNYEALETGVPGQIFIRIRNRLICPIELCQKMSKKFEKAHSKGEDISTRYLFKMFPICDNMQANENNLKNRFESKYYILNQKATMITGMVKKRLNLSQQIRYNVNFKAHHHNVLQKHLVFNIVSEVLNNAIVDFINPNVEFYVFANKGKCLLGMASDCKKYNFNINSMRLTTTQEDITRENQRNSNKRKLNDFAEKPLEPSDVLEDTEQDTTKKVDEENHVDNSTEISLVEYNDDNMEEERLSSAPVEYVTFTKRIIVKRRKIRNHPHLELDDILVI